MSLPSDEEYPKLPSGRVAPVPAQFEICNPPTGAPLPQVGALALTLPTVTEGPEVLR
ncbi:hypothetical protein D3C72_2179160 [compost metagenome]